MRIFGEGVCNIFYSANIKDGHINQIIKRWLEYLRIVNINSRAKRLLILSSSRAAMNTLRVSRLLPKAVKKTRAMNSPNKRSGPADPAAPPVSAVPTAGNSFGFGRR